MKKLLVSFIIISGSLIVNCQVNLNFKAVVDNYRPNDTIRISDCSKLSEISSTDKEYTIVSFTLLYSDKGYDYESISKSNKFTEEMKNNLSQLRLKDNETKYMVIKDIMAESSKNKKVKIDNLYFKLRK